MADVTIPSLTSFTNLNDTDMLVVEQVSSGTGKTTYSNLKSKLKTALVGDADITGLGGSTVAGAIKSLNDIVGNSDAGLHNSLYRGKNLGSTFTSAQRTAINEATFADMYLGDYWSIGNVNYRIAAFDYYFNRGTNAHHVVIVPDSTIGSAVAAHSSNDTSGGYVATTMHTTTLPSMLSTIEDAFGENYILGRTATLSSTMEAGAVTGVVTETVKIELPTMGNCLGRGVLYDATSACNDEDSIQFPLFAYAPRFIRTSGARFWVRDLYGASSMYAINTTGNLIRRVLTESSNQRVRPVFCVYGGA